MEKSRERTVNMKTFTFYLLAYIYDNNVKEILVTVRSRLFSGRRVALPPHFVPTLMHVRFGHLLVEISVQVNTFGTF